MSILNLALLNFRMTTASASGLLPNFQRGSDSQGPQDSTTAGGGQLAVQVEIPVMGSVLEPEEATWLHSGLSPFPFSTVVPAGASSATT